MKHWLNSIESVGYGHPKINQLRNQDNHGLNVNLDKKRKNSYHSDENTDVNRKKSKF